MSTEDKSDNPQDNFYEEMEQVGIPLAPWYQFFLKKYCLEKSPFALGLTQNRCRGMYVCVCVCVYIYIQDVPGGMCQTLG